MTEVSGGGAIDEPELRAWLAGEGVTVLAIAPVEAQGGGWFAPHRGAFEAWLSASKDAEMRWLGEQASARVVPEQLLPGVRSALVLWLNHHFEAPPRPPWPTGRVAQYAWGRDYHTILRKLLKRLRRWLDARAPGADAHLSVDTSPILERAYGERGGAGWIGKSTMLINQQLGTYGSLAVLFTTLALPSALEAHPDRCGRCDACEVGCPTDALADRSLDARRCISYWTIEHRGWIPAPLRSSLGEWVFGCDICQDVCPWNRRAPEGDRARWLPRGERVWPQLRGWLSLSDEALNKALFGSPLRRAYPQGLKRNALIALANQARDDALPWIRAAAQHRSPVVRGTALWSAWRLGDGGALLSAERDPSPAVRADRRRWSEPIWDPAEPIEAIYPPRPVVPEGSPWG